MTTAAANERRPVEFRAASEADGPMPIVLRDALADLADSLGWYEAGVMHGIAMGRQQVIDEWRGRQAVSAAIARQIAEAGPYAELAERRGEPERAARQRAILAGRGIA